MLRRPNLATEEAFMAHASPPLPDEARIQTILNLAEKLGYFPSTRQMKRELHWGSPTIAKHGREARSRWVGPDSPHANRKPKGPPAPTIVGVTVSEHTHDPAALWDRAIIRQRDLEARILERRKDQRIDFDDGPICIAFLSDVHFGAPGTDYAAARHDAQTVRDTPRMFAGFHGDGPDNYVVGRLKDLNMHRTFTITEEWALFEDWVGMLREKWLWWVSGNHDEWTRKAAGFDPIRKIAESLPKILFDDHECVFTLRVGDGEWRIKVRHKWRGGSIFNPSHPIEVGWERGGTPFDIGIGGHTHRGTVIRPFIRHGVKRYAVLTGAYKKEDEYGREQGFEPVFSTGSAAMIFWPDGRVLRVDDIDTAAHLMSLL
jgi:hypothetical protein